MIMHRHKFFDVLGGLVVCFSKLTMAQDIMRVAVLELDRDNRLVQTISSAEDLAAFREIWSTRVKEGAATAMRPTYKIAIQGAGRSETWLYDPQGLARVLTIKTASVYRLPSAAAFNKLLGINRGQ
jgi:hypothetical protein